jgi:serine/threonine protein kinase
MNPSTETEDDAVAVKCDIKDFKGASLPGMQARARICMRVEAEVYRRLHTDFDSHIEVHKEEEYLVVPYIQGCSLDQLIGLMKFSAKQTAHLGYKISSNLRELHTKKVVHRDLKPGNIMITRQGQTALIDFGFSDIHDIPLTERAPVPAGTPYYASPEQYLVVKGRMPSHTVTARTDIYSLGHTLYHANVRETLIESEGDPEETIANHVDGLDWGAGFLGRRIRVGRFADRLRRVKDSPLREILEDLVMTDYRERPQVGVTVELFRAECERRGIEPDAPLFPPLPPRKKKRFFDVDEIHGALQPDA